MRETEAIAGALRDGGVHTFTLGADAFHGNRATELAPYLAHLREQGLNVEIRGSKDALAYANLYPGTAVKGCPIYEDDATQRGQTLHFTVARA